MKYIYVLILCSLIVDASAGWKLSPFRATYKIGIPNMTVAEMTVVVERKEELFLYQSDVTPKGIVGHILNIRAHSYSEITKREERWLPIVYEKEVADKNKKQLYRFDWKNNIARVHYKGEQYDLNIYEGTVDENTFQLKLRDDVIDALGLEFDRNYTLLSDGRLKQRRFIKRIVETVETELGIFEALRIERYKNDTMDQIYWLSRKHDYLPIKIVSLDGERIKTTVTLTALNKTIP